MNTSQTTFSSQLRAACYGLQITKLIVACPYLSTSPDRQELAAVPVTAGIKESKVEEQYTPRLQGAKAGPGLLNFACYS